MVLTANARIWKNTKRVAVLSLSPGTTCRLWFVRDRNSKSSVNNHTIWNGEARSIHQYAHVQPQLISKKKKSSPNSRFISISIGHTHTCIVCLGSFNKSPLIIKHAPIGDRFVFATVGFVCFSGVWCVCFCDVFWSLYGACHRASKSLSNNRI